jgi:hypothetical protein
MSFYFEFWNDLRLLSGHLLQAICHDLAVQEMSVEEYWVRVCILDRRSVVESGRVDQDD